MHASSQLTARFESVFRCVHEERMAGLPILNPALRVWVSDWREWDGRSVGVLLTPWSMSLVCVPGAGSGAGIEHTLGFPSGTYRFVEAEEADIGSFALCSLFSPVFEFADQAIAEATATAALEALFAPQLADAADSKEAPSSGSAKAKLSRRDLLRGLFLTRDPLS